MLAALLLALMLPSTPLPMGQLVDAGGYHVHLYCTGTGSPTVVIAGSAFSFDWALIQPEVAKFARVCSYDPSGTAWSDPPPKPQPVCMDRVQELHKVLQQAGIPAPYILVGFSTGGLIARLYTLEYPRAVLGMVIVDHAFLDVASDVRPPPPVSSDSPAVLISSTPITFGLEDDKNFTRLPQRIRDLHAWAMSRHPLRPTPETAAECFSAVKSSTGGQPYPLENRPLIVIRTGNQLPAYDKLQSQLLLLSHRSKQVLAENSSHMVIIDQPEIVVESVRQVIRLLAIPAAELRDSPAAGSGKIHKLK